MKKKLLFVLLLIAQIATGQQDIHSSFWYKNTSHFNPATPYMGTGFISLNTRMRMQWLTVNGLGMRTNTASVLTKIEPRSANGFITTGVNFYNDQTGNKTLTNNSFSIPINYALKFDRKSFFAIGIAPSLRMRSVNTQGTWDQQWTGTYFDEGLESGELRQHASSAYFDMGAGLFLQRYFGRANYFQLGGSVDHLLQPTYSSGLYASDQLNPRFMLHAGALIGKNRTLSYSPQLLASFQGGNYNAIAGMNMVYHLKESSQRLIYEEGIDLSLGVFYRVMDALIFQAAYRNEGFEVGLSYDTNLSRLTRTTKSVGAVELFLRMNLGSDAQIYSFRRL